MSKRSEDTIARPVAFNGAISATCVIMWATPALSTHLSQERKRLTIQSLRKTANSSNGLSKWGRSDAHDANTGSKRTMAVITSHADVVTSSAMSAEVSIVNVHTLKPTKKKKTSGRG